MFFWSYVPLRYLAIFYFETLLARYLKNCLSDGLDIKYTD